MTFYGSGFDTLDTSVSSVVFHHDSTVCDVLDATPTELTCLVSGFDPATLDTSSAYAMTIQVNGVENTSQSVMILQTK